MIVSEKAAPGLLASATPEADAPNNSLAYAFQWFFFAAAAAAIYVLALRKRAGKSPAEPSATASP
jgi:cytochrome oxidase assembly protein ShyY1